MFYINKYNSYMPKFIITLLAKKSQNIFTYTKQFDNVHYKLEMHYTF